MGTIIFRTFFTAWLAVTLTFIALRALPGDAIEDPMRRAGLPQEAIQARRDALGLNDSLPYQYLSYWGDLLQGDLGQSLVTNENITDMIAVRLAPTAALALTALLVATLLGLLLGSVQAWGLSSVMTTLALATPVYWTSTIAISVFSNQRDSLILPALILGFHASGAIARVVKTALSEAYQQPFIQTARAKGLPPEMIFEHAFRVGILPFFSITALQAGFLLGGTIITEIIFTRRGIGRLLYQSVLDNDYPVVQAIVLLSAITYATTRLIADLLARLADPRQR